MTPAEHVSHFLRLAQQPGAVPTGVHDGNTEPMEVDLPAAVPFSDDFSDGDETVDLPPEPAEHLMNMLADCRAGHAQLKADEAAWSRAQLVGFMAADAVELRNCPRCGSTVAKEITP